MHDDPTITIAADHELDPTEQAFRFADGHVSATSAGRHVISTHVEPASLPGASVTYLETRSLEMEVPIWLKAVLISLGLLSMKKLDELLAHFGSTGDTPVPSSS